MPDYDTAVFKTPATDIGTGEEQVFTFEFSTNMRQEYETVTDYLAEGGAGIISVIEGLLDSGEIGDGGKNQDFKLNLGTGQHVVRIEAEITKGSSNQWGTGDGDPVTDATGAHPVKQAQLLDRVIQETTFDSRDNLARLQIGDYDDSNGPFPGIDVIPENPSFVFDAETESSTATVSMAFVEAANLLQPIDAEERGAE